MHDPAMLLLHAGLASLPSSLQLCFHLTLPRLVSRNSTRSDMSLLTGCGGTTITGNDIATEVAWSSGGGGVSMYYKVPSWQVWRRDRPSAGLATRHC